MHSRSPRRSDRRLSAPRSSLAQSSGQATLRTPTGDQPFTYVEQSGQIYVSAEEVIAGLGGTLTPDATASRSRSATACAAFGPDSRYRRRARRPHRDAGAADLDRRQAVRALAVLPGLAREGAVARRGVGRRDARRCSCGRQQRDAVGVQVSVANVQGISKIVLTLSAPAEYGDREGAGRVRGPLQVAGARAVRRADLRRSVTSRSVTFAGSDLRIQLTGHGRRRRRVSARESAAHRARSCAKARRRCRAAPQPLPGLEPQGAAGHPHHRASTPVTAEGSRRGRTGRPDGEGHHAGDRAQARRGARERRPARASC